MSEISKSALTIGVVALLVGASLVGVGVVLGETGDGGGAMQLADGDGDTGGKSITVTAGGEAETEPDKAIVRVAVEATADDPTDARQQVADNATAMREALLELGVDEDAIRTTDFDIYEDRVRPPDPEREPETTYRARHSFAVEVEDIGLVGEVIDTAVDNGATRVHGVEFTLAEETRRELREDAIAEAMSDARAQADAIAAGSDLTVTGVHAAQTGSFDGPRPVRELAAADGGDGGTSIESGSVSVSATVTVTYNATG